MLLPAARRARLLGVAALLGLIPLQFAVRELAGQEPYPALFLPGFETADHGAIVSAWIPEVIVIDTAGTSTAIDPYRDLLRDFPSSPTSALTTWFRAGLRADGTALVCRPSSGDRAEPWQLRCPGRSRDGTVVLQGADTKRYLYDQVRRVVADPKRLFITWREVRVEVGSGTRLDSEVRLRLAVTWP